MLLKCIDSGGYYLTPGKIYQAQICEDAPSDFFKDKQVFDYYIVNDKGIKHGIEGNLFISIEEVREKKLNELGIK